MFKLLKRKHERERIKAEAKAILAAEVQRWQSLTYDELLQYVGEEPRNFAVQSESGRTFQVEVNVFWDDKPNGDIRVLIAMDGGKGWGIFDFLREDFIASK